MNTDTGQLINSKAFAELRESVDKLPDNIKEMCIPPTDAQLARGKIGLNEPCPCGSGKKFKKCCYTGPETPASLMKQRQPQPQCNTNGVRTARHPSKKEADNGRR